MDELIRAFIARIAERNKIKLLPFNQNSWFTGAYSTISRTLCGDYKPLSAHEKASCQSLLMKTLPGLIDCSFDSALQDLIKKVSSEYKLSIGHSQKLVGILSKYAFTVYRAYPDQLPENWRKFAEKNALILPVPIDAVVLYNLKKRWPKIFNDIKATKTLVKKNNQYSYFAKVSHGDHPVTWSHITDLEVYSSLQNRIRKLAEKSKMLPLEFEMSCLWGDKIDSHVHDCQSPGYPIYIKEGPETYLKITSECNEVRNDGMICFTHGHIWLKNQGRSPRYLIGEINQAGGNFLEEPGYIGLDGILKPCVGGTGYQAGRKLGTVEDAVRYLKQYFDVRACPENKDYAQVRIDQI